MFACMHAPVMGEGCLPAPRFFTARGADRRRYRNAGHRRPGHLFGSVHDIAHAIARRAAVPVNVAVASNPDAAFHAARGFSGISIVPQGDEAKFLASLPVALLRASEEIAETLARWGIRTFRDLAVLPDLGVAARLGRKASGCSSSRAGKATGRSFPWKLRCISRSRWNSNIRWNCSSR